MGEHKKKRYGVVILPCRSVLVQLGPLRSEIATKIASKSVEKRAEIATEIAVIQIAAISNR